MKKTILFFAVALFANCCFLAAIAQDNSVRNIAGGLYNQTGFLDGVFDTMALFNNITAISGDAADNIYILDQGNNRVRKINGITHLVTTIAGNGTAGFSGDGGPAVLAQIGAIPLYSPYPYGGICADTSGNVYFSDISSGRIRKINQTTGIITTFAGGGTHLDDSIPATDADISPLTLVYYNGCVYVSDQIGAIKKIDISTGVISTVYGTFDYDIYHFTIGNSGEITISRRYGTEIIKIGTSGTISTISGQSYNFGFAGDGGLATNAKLISPRSIALDTSNNIYFIDDVLIRKINKNNNVINAVAGPVDLDFNLLLYGPGVGTPNLYFPSHLDVLRANVLSLSHFYPTLLYTTHSGQMLLAVSNCILQYNAPSFSINTMIVKDSALTARCTLPSRHKYALKGTLNGVPATGDSMVVSIDFQNGTSLDTLLPYYSFIDTSGVLVYGFGSDSFWVGPSLYDFPGIYPVSFTYNNRHGLTDLIRSIDTAGSSCNYGYPTSLIINEVSERIISPPCAPVGTVEISVGGNASDYPALNDSVYLNIIYGDGTSDLHVIAYDSASYHFHYTTLHNYPQGSMNVRPDITATLNSGIAHYTTVDNAGGPYPMPTFNIPDCSTDSLTSSIYTSDSSVTICSLPFVANFTVGTTLFGAADTTNFLSYYVNFGDGSDTTVTLGRYTDSVGNYFMRDTIYHTYTIPGAYITSITPSDTSGTSLGATLTVGTSCSPLSGVFYRDGNATCTADAGETRLGYWPMAVVNNTLHDTTYAWCDTFGHYALSLIDGDNYTIIPNYFGYFGLGADSFRLSCPSAVRYTITPTVGSTYTQDFGFTCGGAPTAMDMSVSGWGWGFVPGDTGVIGIWSSNEWGYMCDSLSSTVTLTIDPLLNYLGMWDGPAPTSVSGSTLSWTFSTQANLLDFHADVKVRTSTSATMGATACNILQVSPTGLPDNDTTNNTYTWCEPIRSSWDPNEKEVSPKGFGPEGYIQNGTPLNYVVHFQNTGTAPARNITINDTISENLDIATLQVISSSGAVLVYQPEMTGRLIKFRFNDIYLPDSTTNPSGSMGYIAYSIVPKPNLAPNTQIVNTAGIYFDYNPAVVTNTTVNTIEGIVGSISGLPNVCVGNSITLTNSLAGGVWRSSNSHATVMAGVVTGVTTGIDTIYYTVYGEQTVSQIITVNPLPDAGTIIGIPTLCTETVTTLSNIATGGTWTSSTLSVTIAGGVATGITAGNSIISYSVTNSCGTAVDTMMVTVNPLPDAGVITGTPTVCAAATATLSNVATGGTWTSSASSATIIGGVVSGVTVGSTVISYTVTNSCGTAVDTMMVTVNPLPVAGVITGATNVCIGATITLSNTATGGIWMASIPAATVAGGVVTGVSAGNVVIFYTVTNSCGNASDTMAVTVVALADAGTITGATSVCVGATTSLANAATGGTWSSAGTTATVSTSGVVSGTTAGSATISYIVTNTCGADTTVSSMTINALPDAGSITGVDSVCMGEVITLADAATGAWSSANSGIATVSTTGVVTGVTSGGGGIVYTATNSCGMDTATKLVWVRNPADCNTGINTTSTQTINIGIYPNPNNGTFTLAGKWPTADGKEVTVEIVNMLGQLVYKNDFNNNGIINEQIQAGNTLAAGTYVLTLHSNGESKMFHFVVKE